MYMYGVQLESVIPNSFCALQWEGVHPLPAPSPLPWMACILCTLSHLLPPPPPTPKFLDQPLLCATMSHAVTTNQCAVISLAL